MSDPAPAPAEEPGASEAPEAAVAVAEDGAQEADDNVAPTITTRKTSEPIDEASLPPLDDAVLLELRGTLLKRDPDNVGQACRRLHVYARNQPRALLDGDVVNNIMDLLLEDDASGL